MKNWQVTLKIGDTPPEQMTLTDLCEVIDGYLNINRTFFDELINIVKMIKKYAIGKGVEKVIGPDEKEWTNNPWLMVMFKDNEKNVPFWTLIKREKDLTGYLVAIGPANFVEYCKASKEPDDEIKRLLEYLIAYPQKFKVSIVIPNFIS
jgi:hypothetical protein